MASAAPPAAPVPPAATNGDSSDWLELVRVFESMRVQLAKAEEKLKSERLANRQAEQHIEKERQSFAIEMAEQRRLLAEERREAQREREALEAEKRALEAQRQDSQQESNAVGASAKHPMPMRTPPPQSASSPAAATAPETHSRVKAAPARVKEAPKPRGTASLDLPPPKAKARTPATPVAGALSEASTAIGAADGGSCSSAGGRGDGAVDAAVVRDLEIEDVDNLSDTPPVKPEEADEADRLALEDDAETTQQPAKAPPEPPIYWRHVKPPPKTGPDKADEDRESEVEVKDESAKEVEAKAAVKANPAWASRPKGPPATQEDEVGNDTPAADNGSVMASPPAAPGRPPPKASASQQGFGVLKAPPARCPPKAKASQAPSSADCDDAPSPVPKGKVKAPPSADSDNAAPVPKSKVKAPPVDSDNAPEPVPQSKVKAAPCVDRDNAPAVPQSKVKAAPGKAKVKAPPGR